MLSSTIDTEVGVRSPAALDGKVHMDAPSTDFGILPIPKRLRYDPDKPFHFGLVLNASFGFISTFSTCLYQQDRFFLTPPSRCEFILLSTLVEYAMNFAHFSLTCSNIVDVVS